MDSATRETQVTVREMTASDIDAVSALRIRGWQYAYAGLMPQSYLDGLDVAADAARRRERFAADSAMTQLVAETAEGAVAGWACFGPAQDRDLPAGEGELYALYARPDLIGSGVGRALMAEVLGRAPYPGLRLWVVEGNARARRFYERAGFAPDGGTCADEVGGVPVPEVRYHRPRP
ncbi:MULTISPECIES: GNAT family N-acetyltransferase [unclassified Streptomyces]|uniref:GNAT family N-acetyltransferase n=1 Tax=unclassified Streptomyces TaxID=2593676 RepID=UPI0022547921|nr:MULTISPECIES: GNAT family N-acetyltransferase [unclassified Streptomyces]MCX4524198.1 GNAT family N-acetyltransferase [Streptomyces sp. NBC_01551]MCX4545283.1 GNAT family N-acetyltransferase [Streptomyces sp. NBC_01565]